MDDPFRHHPVLRDTIKPPETSFFYDFSTEKLQALLEEHGVRMPSPYTDEEREALREATLNAAPGEDFWVFGYGSLMWDPGFHFTEIRRARIAGYSRQFILKDDVGARGTAERPGLMAGLAPGEGCDGLAFRLPADAIEEETTRIWRRELIGPAYMAKWHQAETDFGAINAVVLVADPAADVIELSLPYDMQVEYLATGEGVLGSSHDYLSELIRKLRILKIDDAALEALWIDVQARRAALCL